VAQHNLPNYELCHETIDSERAPKSGQVQLQGFGAHARATFASVTIGSINYPFAMLFHIELA
jgi:hypothetical protein